MNAGSMGGRTAIVWGGAAGTGAATCRGLAAAGARIVVADRDAAAAAILCDELRRAGGEAMGIETDVREPESVEHTVAAAREALGVPTLSAGVVGVAGWADLISMTPAMWDEQMALNLRPMFLIGGAMARALRAAEQPGALAFVGSIAGSQAAVRHAAYGAAKAAMAALAQSMAMEWGTLGIRVNCVAPGPIATPRIAPSPEMEALFARKLPAGRFGTAEEVARCLCWLLSDDASFVTGTTMLADGGWMAAAPITPDDNPRLPSG